MHEFFYEFQAFSSATVCQLVTPITPSFLVGLFLYVDYYSRHCHLTSMVNPKQVRSSQWYKTLFFIILPYTSSHLFLVYHVQYTLENVNMRKEVNTPKKLTQILMKNGLSLYRKSRKNPRPHLRCYLSLGFFDLAILWWYPLFCYCRWDWRYWQVGWASFHNSFLHEPVHFKEKNFIEIKIHKSVRKI